MFKSFKVDFSDLARILDELLPETSTPTSLCSDNELEIYLPGVIKESIEITPNGKILNIKAKTKKGKEFSIERWINREIDAEQTTAKYEDGVLTIKFKPKESKQSKIKVE